MDPIIKLNAISKQFGKVNALEDISFELYPGEVHCLLGDNGAGKSTLIKILSGVHRPSRGQFLFEGKPVQLDSPRQALDLGIATVFQDLAMLSLMSITRNFFLGREPKKRLGPVEVFDSKYAAQVAEEELRKIGIKIRDGDQPVGTLSGGERQAVAIARAVYFGAKVLILDEPTSALGVKEAAVVLKYIVQSKLKGIGVIFITHNVHHAWAVGDTFTVLNRGRSYGTFKREQTHRENLLQMMAGGEELDELAVELDLISKRDPGQAGQMEHRIAEELE
ncbi:MAG TPA: ATP-binding cassette domain-containing protein [Chthoniobacterales bacterium]|jgi:simple sugar transport system ATP-binding protein|nr:ATP-binding cassette domain-containing protein [Chthoniobacterales bacterium]